MFSYQMEYDHEYKYTPGSLRVYKDGKYHDTVSFFWVEFNGFYFYDKDRTLKIGHGWPKHSFKTFDEAIEGAKAMFNPFDYIVEKINKQINRNIEAAKQRMHLRIAEFRGNLFSQIQALRS